MACFAIAAATAISAAASYASAKTVSGAAKDAAQTQAEAGKAAADAQLEMFYATQKNLAPYMNAGTSALAQLQALTGTAPQGSAPVNGLGGAPFGFGAPQGPQTAAPVQWVNKTSGQTWLAPSSGYIPPSADWAPASAPTQTWNVGANTLVGTPWTPPPSIAAPAPQYAPPPALAPAPLPPGITVPAGGWPKPGANGLFPGQKSSGDKPSSGNNFFGFGSLEAAFAGGVAVPDKPEYAQYASANADKIQAIKAAMAGTAVAPPQAQAPAPNPPVAPPGFTAPAGMATQATVPYYNLNTGQTWTAPTGGWTPGPGWVPASAAAGVTSALEANGAPPASAQGTTAPQAPAGPTSGGKPVYNLNGVPVFADGTQVHDSAFESHGKVISGLDLPSLDSANAPITSTDESGNALVENTRAGGGPVAVPAQANPLTGNPIAGIGNNGGPPLNGPAPLTPAQIWAQALAAANGYSGSGGSGASGEASAPAPAAGGITTAETPLNALNAPLTAPFAAMKSFNPTQADLENTPGYKFVLNQGLKTVQNSYAAQGLGLSGAAIRGAIDYTTGLAGTQYQQQFANYLTQYQQQFNDYWQGNQNIYNMLSGQVTTGANAASGNATNAINSQTQANNLLTSGAAAQAAGQVGSANAIGAGLSGVSSAAQNGLLLNLLSKGGMFTKVAPVAAAGAGTP